MSKFKIKELIWKEILPLRNKMEEVDLAWRQLRLVWCWTRQEESQSDETLRWRMIVRPNWHLTRSNVWWRWIPENKDKTEYVFSSKEKHRHITHQIPTYATTRKRVRCRVKRPFTPRSNQVWISQHRLGNQVSSTRYYERLSTGEKGSKGPSESLENVTGNTSKWENSDTWEKSAT